VDEKVAYWLELAQYDFDTAKVMLSGKRYLYVGFMCHQTIEKVLKANYVHIIKDTPSHVHNLALIAKKSGIYDSFSDEHKDFLDFLEPLNVEARYPTVKDKIMQSLSEEKCELLVNKTEELFLWIKTKLLK
jgi:HEPN domain-containing protein